MAILTEAQNFIRLKSLSAAQCGTSSDSHQCLNRQLGNRGECEESIISRQQSTQARDPPWLWNPRQLSPEVQNKGISGLALKVNNVRKLLERKRNTFFVFFLQDISLYRGATDIPVLGPKFQSQCEFLICMFHPLHPVDSSNSPLVRHLLTYWWPAWQLSLFDLHTCTHVYCQGITFDTLNLTKAIPNVKAVWPSH